MSRLIRRTYGYGGTPLKRVAVSACALQTPPTPLWLKLSTAALLIILPFLVGRYAVPTSSVTSRTIIDTSRLDPAPTLILEPAKSSESDQTRSIERVIPTPEIPPPQTIPKIAERSTVTPITAETERPVISRSLSPTISESGTYRPGVTRERGQVAINGDSAATTTRIRREAAVGEAPSAGAAISRSRSGGANAMDSAYGGNAIGVRQRSAPVGRVIGDGGIGIGTSSSPTIVRRGQPSRAASGEGNAQSSATIAARSRSGAGNNGGSGEGNSGSSVGAVRGISLMSLEICSSSELQEEKTKDVLSVVGSRTSCRNNKGEFQFRGTRRISSFNLIIFPSQGRKPSNRCKELEYAYHCLTTH